MTLNAYVSAQRRVIFEDLKSGQTPSSGTFDAGVLKDARTKGVPPQLGSTRFLPDTIELEFIFPDARGASVVLVVQLTPPERIVYLPVPTWVVESIWQGEIAGSYHFESDARGLLNDLTRDLEPEANLRFFGRQEPTRRD